MPGESSRAQRLETGNDSIPDANKNWDEKLNEESGAIARAVIAGIHNDTMSTEDQKILMSLERQIERFRTGQGEKQIIPVLIYTGMSVQTGASGATYDRGVSASYLVPEDITFKELRKIVIQTTGLNEETCTINISARLNFSSRKSFYFRVIPLVENGMWRMVVEKTMSGATGLFAVELLVDSVPKSGRALKRPREKSPANVEDAETREHHACRESLEAKNKESQSTEVMENQGGARANQRVDGLA